MSGGVSSAAGGGGEPQRGGWVVGGGAGSAPDERDSLIAWLRSEFAAANAIIDLLLGHLHATAVPGEYEHVDAAVHQRRVHWTPVIHLQQHFPVADVALALQQAAWHRRSAMQPPATRRPGFRHAHNRFDQVRESHAPVAAFDQDPKPNVSASASDNEDSENAGCKESTAHSKDDNTTEHTTSPESSVLNDHHTSDVNEVQSNCVFRAAGTKEIDHQVNGKLTPIPTAYILNEVVHGRMVNVIEGLKFYEALVNEAEVNRIILWLNDLKAQCQQGELNGKTYTIAKRPMKGHGREFIQLGIPIVDSPFEDSDVKSNHGERKVEAIPDFMHSLFDHLSQLDVISTKPDYCVVDFFNEGDHSLPHSWASCYGRPIYTLCLTDCNMVFGHPIAPNHRGDHRGRINLSLPLGSFLVLQGSSADVAKRAIPSTRKKRILLTFGKSRRGSGPPNGYHSQTGPVPRYSLGLGPVRSPDVHYPNGSKHFAVTKSGNYQAPPNGIPPLFIASPPVAVPFPAACPSGNPVAWKVDAPLRPMPMPQRMHLPVIGGEATPRSPGSGTGVFFPPGPGHAPQSQPAAVTHGAVEPNSSPEPACTKVPNGGIAPTKEADELECNCNGSSHMMEKE